MMNHPLFLRPVLAGFAIAVVVASSPVVQAAVPDPDATKLTGKYGCQGCHGATTKLVGPLVHGNCQEVRRR